MIYSIRVFCLSLNNSTDYKLVCSILSSPLWWSCTFLMAHSKAKVQSNDYEAFLCFGLFCVGNVFYSFYSCLDFTIGFI